MNRTIKITRERGEAAKITTEGIVSETFLIHTLTGTTDGDLFHPGTEGHTFWVHKRTLRVNFREHLDLLNDPLEKIQRILCERIRQVRAKVQEIPLTEELVFEIEEFES